MGSPHAAAVRRRTGRDGWPLLFVLSGNMLLDAVEVSVVLVALPAIGADLGLDLWSVQWLMSGFALGFAVFLLLGPRLTAAWGLRRSYLVAMLVFAAASLAGGLSTSMTLLVASRVVKGACAALTAPAGLALIGETFPSGPRQRRAVSVYSMFGAYGFSLGLVLSGVLVADDWHWTFLFPAPVALLLLAVGHRVIPDVKGQAPPVFGAALFRNGPLMRAVAGAGSLNGVYIGLLLLATFTMSGSLGWQAWQTALALLPACLPLAISVPFAGHLIQRFGTSRLIAAGALLAFAAQLLALALSGRDSYGGALLPSLLLVGAAFVVSFAALNMQATQSTAPALRRAAVPVYQTGVQIGSVVMLPLVAALLNAPGGQRSALLATSVLAALGLAVAATGLRTRPGAGES
ncbi:Predicted arabinose efflux permease, MFS family [Thermomonospora echinospora]|uniref:Predicted arabinose efflux permease, MFS family n=1 Tax=Thermomonospora echinospora TaxID=1992 RepID=A0A1H6DZ13_9ACTN|nr:MFS transporter [Thermomonospora echinospora]SEG90369.1 Predicted arabinose efflux permease, MFS family [Thermomonospora echinospora]